MNESMTRTVATWIMSKNDMMKDLRRFATQLEERKHLGLQLQWKVSVDETHNSIFSGALSSDLRFVLDARR